MKFEKGPNTDMGYELAGAVIVYEKGERYLAIWHDSNGNQLVPEGRPMDLAEVCRLTRYEAEAGIPDLLPEGLLSFGERSLIWRKKSHRGAIHLKTKDKKLNAQSGKEIQWPELLFAAHSDGTLRCYIPYGSGRETELYLAPFYNCWNSGRICLAAGKKAGIGVSDMEANEKLFFESFFTHPDSRDLCSEKWDLEKILKVLLAGGKIRKGMLKKWGTLGGLLEELK